VALDPGICGFPCIVEATRIEKRRVLVTIRDSECEHVQRLSESFNEIGLRELFAPISRNPVFISAERAGCHPSCPIPIAVMKAVEVAMDMALPRDAGITFGDHERVG
jgi:hypothetical protein